MTRASTSTDAAGCAIVRGFCGTYDVTVTTADGFPQEATARLDRAGARLRVTVARSGPPADLVTTREVVLE
jgi:hypothetical protein